MINDLSNLDLSELKTFIDFHETRHKGKCNYLNICELFINCQSCPIGKVIEDGMDCEEVFLAERYKHIITEELVKEVQDKNWDICNCDCENCKLQEVRLNGDECMIMVESLINNFTIETEEEKQAKIDKEKLEARIKTIEKKIDMILQILLEKNN